MKAALRSETADPAALASGWLARFEDALAARDEAKLRALFLSDSHWRDVLALTWKIQTLSGKERITKEIQTLGVLPGRFQLDGQRTPPRRATRGGKECIEAIFRFETEQGLGAGVVRFSENELENPQAWTLLTSLEDLKLKKKSSRNDDRQPTVLVVGGGHAGLSIAARLARRGIDTLIVDRWPRVGDNWRRRYHALALHNQVHVNHLPYLPFPPGFPVYIPKDQLADWFEAYAKAMELNYWTSTEFKGGSHDGERWQVTVETNGRLRELQPKHVVLATGVSGIPNVPRIDSLKSFSGRVLHSSQYDDGEAWRGKKAVVVGTGNSGHDIAQDLHAAGAQVTLAQRSPTLIIQRDPSAQLVYSLYGEGPPLEDCDLLTISVPLKISRESHKLATAHARELDKPLLDALEAKGFKLDWGEDGTGWQFKYLTRGGGYYFNVGCSDLIAEGKIAFSQIDQLEEHLKDANLVVLATGYKGQEALVGKLFGEEVAKRVGPIWGFGADQELRNMFQRTPQPGLWFIAGSFAQCRIYSKYLALQIEACEAGLLQGM